MKVAVYSVLFSDYDNWQPPIYFNKEYDYFLFTDQPIKSNVYTVINTVPAFADPIKSQRMIKINSCKFLPEYDITIYHDASIRQFMAINSLVLDMRTDLAVMNHPTRNCVYDEYQACCTGSKDNNKVMHKQVQRYFDEEFPVRAGMVATGILIRKQTEAVKAFEWRWWNEVAGGSIRDQLSFNYCLQGLKIDLFPWSILGSHFLISKHK